MRLTDKPYRPSLSQQDMTDILAALEVDNEQRLKAAVKEKDPDAALHALEHRVRVDNLRDRFVRMALDRIPKDTQVPGQMSMDEAFDQRKEQAEAEERADAIVDHYQSIDAA